MPAGRRWLANHNRAWIWGRHVVGETLHAGRWPVGELALSPSLEARCSQEFTRLAKAANIPIVTADDAELTRLCRASDHQGCAARMAAFPYLSGEQLVRGLTSSSLLVVLDRIQDPFNLGAIIRSVECLGLDGVVIGSSEQTGVNSQVARSSAGAVNHVPVCRVESLIQFLSELSSRNWQIWGASERGTVALPDAKFQPPLALILGNEGTGIQPELLLQCTGTVQIPMSGRVGSLNAAVSAGILCYEAAQSRQLRNLD